MRERVLLARFDDGVLFSGACGSDEQNVHVWSPGKEISRLSLKNNHPASSAGREGTAWTRGVTMVTATCSGGDSLNRCLDPATDASIRAACDGPREALLLFRQHRVAALGEVGVRAADRFLDVHRRGVGDEILDAVVVEVLALGAFDRVARIVVVDLVGCGEVDGDGVGG